MPWTALADRFVALTPDVVAAIAPDGRVVRANPALEHLTGLDAEALAGRHVRCLVHADDADLLAEQLELVAAGNREVDQLEVRLAVTPSAHRHFLISLTADAEAELVWVIGKDVDDRHAALVAMTDAEERFRTAFDHADVGMTMTSLDGHLVRVNAAFAELVGRTTDQLVGMHVSDLTHPDDREHDEEYFRAKRAGEDVRRQKRYLRPDGAIVHVSLSFSTVRSPEGAPLYSIGHVVGLDERRAAERALAESERRFRTLASASPAGIFASDDAGRILYANTRLAEIFGVPEGELDSRKWMARLSPESQAAVAEASREAADTGRPVRVDVRMAAADDATARWARLHVSTIEDGEGGTRFVGTVEDVTDQINAQRALAAREAEFRMLAEHSGDFLSRHDAADGRYLYASPACEAMLGMAPEELVGRTPGELGLVHPEDRERFAGLVALLHDGRDLATAAYRIVKRDGSVRWLETAARRVRDAGSSGGQLVAVTRDVTERKAAEAELAHQAMHDSLTGLPNRALFSDRLEQALRRSSRYGSKAAVLFVDLDRFKLINDSFGHAAGDRLLCDVADRLRAVLRPMDTIARFGGDELTVLCEDLPDAHEASRVAERIAALFAEPFVVDGTEAFMQASVGIAIARTGATPDDVLRDADAAMYRAKERGRGRIEVFDEEMRRDARERVATESALRRALERGELRAHVQPVVSLKTGRVQGFEALVRWQHPERGLLGPGAFIPLAEETGLTVPIGEWMVRETCRTLRRWHTEVGAPWAQCAVNLSGRHLNQPDLVESVRAALSDHDVPADRLVLEITEGVFMESGPAVVDTLHALRDLGVRLALDDFGTGYSSLAHLHRFPLHVLKIDRSFIANLGNDGGGASIAGAIASLAEALGLRTVAEGIETEAQLEAVRRLGCNFGQGFLLARPQPPEHFDAVLLAAGAP